jgi:tRNA A-37 threonylcarbamoyl transferase component Bud32
MAEGFMGTIDKSPDGTRVVKRLKEGREWGPHEVELQRKMGNLGFSPKIRSHSADHVEMDMAKGKPLWKDFKKGDDEPVMNAAQAKEASKAIKTLHKMGYFHGDMHSQQWLVNGNDVQLIDYGLSGRTSAEPVKALQDLAKIKKLVNFDNPELQSDPYVSTAKRYLDQYSAIKGTSKAAKAEKERLAKEYLEEIKGL